MREEAAELERHCEGGGGGGVAQARRSMGWLAEGV